MPEALESSSLVGMRSLSSMNCLRALLIFSICSYTWTGSLQGMRMPQGWHTVLYMQGQTIGQRYSS